MEYLAIGAAYLMGSIPFGYIVSKFFLKVDIRRHGSGNIGATNVLRLLGWRGALPVLLLDAGKGAAAVYLAGALGAGTSVVLAAAAAALLGHCFPIFLKFKGGKGAATGIGLLIALSGYVSAFTLLIAIFVIALTRYVSLGSIIGALSVPLLFFLFHFETPYIVFGAAMALLVLLRHRDNIKRLLAGNESKFGRKIVPPGEKN